MAYLTTATGTFGRTGDLTLDLGGRDQTMQVAPTFAPFKFEHKRTRIDWRLLHGVDINSVVSTGEGSCCMW